MVSTHTLLEGEPTRPEVQEGVSRVYAFDEGIIESPREREGKCEGVHLPHANNSIMHIPRCQE
jgi:hypothetical protein